MPTESAEYDRRIEEPGPGENVGDVGDPQSIRPFRGEAPFEQVRCRTRALPAPDGAWRLVSAHAGQACPVYERGDPFAPGTHASGRVSPSACRPSSRSTWASCGSPGSSARTRATKALANGPTPPSTGETQACKVDVSSTFMNAFLPTGEASTKTVPVQIFLNWHHIVGQIGGKTPCPKGAAVTKF